MNIIFKNWSLMRWIRLILSFGLVIAFFSHGDWFYLFVASFFIIQVIFNVGCANGACEVPATSEKTSTPSEK